MKSCLLLAIALPALAQEYVISTFAGGVPPTTPVLGVNMPIGLVQSVAADAAGNAYFVAFHRVFQLDANGVVTRIAGNGRAGYSGDGGPATSAQLRLDSILRIDPFGLGAVGGDALPPGMAVDTDGNVYVADNDNYRSAGSRAMEPLLPRRATVRLGSPATEARPRGPSCHRSSDWRSISRAIC